MKLFMHDATAGEELSTAVDLATSSGVFSVNTLTGAVILDTDDIGEGAVNLYHTVARAKAAAVANTITDGITDVAPSQNAVFDALALKQDASGTAAAAKAAAVADSITDGVTDVAPSQNAVFDALALKRDLADNVDLTTEVTGLLPIANQVSQPHTLVVNIDKNRADSYTEDGSLTRPYKTIKAAVLAVTATASAKVEFHIAPGAYVEANDLSFKEWMYVVGAGRDLVTISRSDTSAVVIDFTANVSHRMGISNVTFLHGLTVDRTGDTTGGANVDLMNVWVGGAFSYVGTGSGFDYLNMKGCSVTGAATITGVSGIINWCSFYSTLTMGTTGAVNADLYGYYALITFEGTYVAGNISATAASAKPAGYQLFHTNGDGNWTFNGTAAIDLYTDHSGPLMGNTVSKTNTTTYRYGYLQHIGYAPAATNWQGTAPNNVHDALERMAALLKTLNLGIAIP